MALSGTNEGEALASHSSIADLGDDSLKERITDLCAIDSQAQTDAELARVDWRATTDENEHYVYAIAL